ncbi:MAG: EamA family transporter [Oscillibacter sp.]|nr:EamA family transporter [Oscillibacter sp.]MBQ8851654.1 EamA family transporter [Oscillibacter sp.]
MSEERSRVVRGTVSAGIGGVFWGFSGTCGQYLFSEFGVSSLWVTCLRLLSAGLLMTILAVMKHRSDLVKIWKEPRDVGLLLLFGIFGLMLCQYSYLSGIAHSNAATTTVLQQLSLVIVMLIACLQTRRLPKALEVLALVLAIFGTFMISTGGNPDQMLLSPQGLFWGITTACACAAYNLLSKSLLSRWSREAVCGIGMIFGGVVLSTYAKLWTYDFALPLRGWLAFGCIVLFGTVIAFSFFLQGIRDAGPVRASMMGVTEPLSAAVFSSLWLGTSFSAAELIGFAAILITMLLLAKND